MPRFDEPDVTAEDVLNATKGTAVIDFDNFTAVGQGGPAGQTGVPDAQFVSTDFYEEGN